jgi:hypothetical protein
VGVGVLKENIADSVQNKHNRFGQFCSIADSVQNKHNRFGHFCSWIALKKNIVLYWYDFRVYLEYGPI